MITESSRQPTGRAIIQLSSKGENAIIVSKGSNNEVEINDDMFDNHQILLVQNEINSSATNKAMEIAYLKGLIVCMNPSPFPLSKTELNFQKVNILIMNEHETNQLIAIYNYTDLFDCDFYSKMRCIMVNSFLIQGRISKYLCTHHYARIRWRYMLYKRK